MDEYFDDNYIHTTPEGRHFRHGDGVEVDGEGNPMTAAKRVGTEVGAAIARDVLADGLPREWTGLDDQDGDRLTAAGIEPKTPEWAEAEEAAEAEYRRLVG